MKSMSGIICPLEGRSLLDGENILDMSLKKRAKLVAYVPQNTNTVFPVRVIDAVMMGRKPFQSFCASREDEKECLSFWKKWS